MLDIPTIRADFPILARTMSGHPLVYLDNAATTQKPRAVLDALVRYYEQTNANAHRGVYELAEEATREYEVARGKVAAFLGVPAGGQVVFVRNATEGINLVAHAWGTSNVSEGDEILLTGMEHHSNLVPWHLLARRTGCKVRAVPVTDEGLLDMDAFRRMLNPRVRLVGVVHASNVLGTINPVKEIARLAAEAGAAVLVDGAQSSPHMPVHVGEINCDFFALSGHKMLGPMGIGAIYIRESRLASMEPFLGGGEMIRDVTLTASTYADPPWRYEAGTPNVADAVGLGAAIDYLNAIGMDAVAEHDRELGAYAREALSNVRGMRMFGPGPGPHSSGSLVSFAMDGVHPHDVAQELGRQGIAIRAGHHCAQPLMKRFAVPATSRASFYIYNDRSEVDRLVSALQAIAARYAPQVASPGADMGIRDLASREPDDELYREVVLDHYLHPAGRDPLPDAQIEWSGKNPLCGDEVTLRLKVINERIEGIQVLGHGCSVSVASGSMLASQLKGRTVDEGRRLLRGLKAMLKGEPLPADLDMGDLVALEGLKNLPVRVKCALLPWTTFEEGIGHSHEGCDHGHD